ncbi:MAG: TonB-dependent receptor, partial [Sphingobacteriales bacterium]
MNKFRLRASIQGTLLLLLLSVQFNVFGQNTKRITGTVKSATGNFLPGASVSTRDGAVTTATDSSGNFSITVPDSVTALMISSVGFAAREVGIAGQTVLAVSLTESAETMSDVVVVGYGTVKKSDLTGSVVSLKSDDLTPGANYNVQQSLQGRASGVQVYQKSGEPGSAMSVKIRGASSITAGNEPLYVIDGMPVNDAAPVASAGVAGTPGNPNPRNTLNSLNPSDIQSIEIRLDLGPGD